MQIIGKESGATPAGGGGGSPFDTGLNISGAQRVTIECGGCFWSGRRYPSTIHRIYLDFTERNLDLHPLLQDFIKACRNADEPPTQTYPCNVTIIRDLFKALDLQHQVYGTFNRGVIDL